VGQLLGYELPPVIALMGVSLALGDGVRSRRLLKESQRDRERQARLDLERRAAEPRNEERLRLARDLHDALGHSVAMISLQSAVAAEALPARVPEAQRAVAEIRDISVAAMGELRSTVRRLRSLDSAVELPAGLDELPGLAEQARENGLGVWIVEVGDQRDVPDALGRAAYRIVEEVLTNVIRHANATKVTVTLDRGPDALTVTVRDDGQGAAEVVEGNGVRGMRERAIELGGRLQVTTPGPRRRNGRHRGAALAAPRRGAIPNRVRDGRRDSRPAPGDTGPPLTWRTSKSDHICRLQGVGNSARGSYRDERPTATTEKVSCLLDSPAAACWPG
jgi:signal transduction histidine kinase